MVFTFAVAYRVVKKDVTHICCHSFIATTLYCRCSDHSVLRQFLPQCAEHLLLIKCLHSMSFFEYLSRSWTDFMVALVVLYIFFNFLNLSLNC